MSAQGSTAGKRTNVRLYPVLVLVLIATLINYLDRSVFGIAQPLLAKELDIGPVELGWILSAFGWSYAASQIPGGIFLDRFGTRITYAFSLITWSFFTLAQGVVSSVGGLIGMRLGLGVCEAPCFPANSRVLATWFPQHERARANGVYAIGQYAGQGFLSIPLIWIAATFGWRELFFIVGGLGMAFGILWFVKYRDPQHSKEVNQAELDYIEAGGGLTPKGNRVVFSWKNVGWLMSQRQVIGASLAQFCGNSTLVFFLTWFPTYLVTERHMAYVKTGFALALPFIAGAVGVFLGGILSDMLLKKTGSANLARKLPVILGLLLASVIILANYVPADNNTLVIGIMSVAFFGQGLTNLGWTVISDVAPKKLIGLTGGIFNFVTNLAGILTPIIIGYALALTGSFVGPLVYTSILALLGVCSYLFIIGDIKRLELD